MVRWSILVAIVVLGLAPRAAAQNAADLEGRRIAAVHYDPPVEGRDAAPDSGLQPGATLTAPAVREALRKLFRQRRFSDVRILAEPNSDGTVTVLVHTRPIQRIGELRVVGNRVLGRDQVSRALGLLTDREVATDDLPGFEAAVERAYAERGYGAARASATLSPLEQQPERVQLLLRVEEGPPVLVGWVRIEGKIAIERDKVREIVRPRAGSVFDQIALRESLGELRELYRSRGYYNVQIAEPQTRELPTGRIGVLIAVQAGDRYEIRFAGNRRAPHSELLGALELEGERDLSAAVIATLAQRASDYYHIRGFRHARVTARIVDGVAPGVTAVVFEIDEGRQVRVERLVFEGNRHFAAGFLREQVYSFLEERIPEQLFFQPMDVEALDMLGVSGRPGGSRSRIERAAPIRVVARQVYHEETYSKAVEHLLELYKVEGFTSVRIAEPEIEERLGTATVRIRIVEGPQTRIAAVRYRGNRALTSAELARATELHAGEPLALTTTEQALARLKELYASRAFLFAHIEQSVQTSEDGRRARITFDIEERAQVRVASIAIRGNELTSAALIRGRLTFEAGDTFTPREAERSRDRLLALGIFRTVTIEPLDPDVEERSKPVVVTVRERKTQYVDLRAGGSTGEGLRFGLEYGYRNLFGYALTFTARLEFSYQVFFYDPDFEEAFRKLALGDQLERRVVVGLTLPSTPGANLMTTGLQVSHQRQNELTFGYSTVGVLLSVSTGALRPLAPRLDLGLETADQAIFNQGALDAYLRAHPGDLRLRRLLRVPTGESAFGTIGSSLSLDLRDNPFTPTRGFFASATSEVVRSLSEELESPSKLLKVSSVLSGYVPLGRTRIVLAISGRIGRVFHLSEKSRTYQNRRFFLGGIDTIRGFPEESLIPQDLADEAKEQAEESPTGTPVPVIPGGEAFVTMRGELRFPIFGGLALGLFLDTGNLWNRVENAFAPFTLRYALGAGFRYLTPVGAIALDYGVNLEPRRFGDLDEPAGAVHFSIGLF